VLPFAVAAALPFVLTLVFGPSAGSADFVASGILTALLTVVPLAVPWTRVPVPLRATVPLAYFAVMFLLRNSSAAAAAVFTPLVLLPVIWLALYGTRAQLIAAFVLLALTLILPILVLGALRYPSTEWLRVAIYLVIASIVGVTIHRLMTATRDAPTACERARRRSAPLATCSRACFEPRPSTRSSAPIRASSSPCSTPAPGGCLAIAQPR
jgi:hypothetical protein